MRRQRQRTARDRESHLELRVDAAAAGAGLRVLGELGEGGTARVCLVVPRDADPFSPFDGSRAAMKVSRFENTSGRRVREDRVLAAVRSPHVVALLGTPGVEGDTLLLDHLSGGTLAELLARREFIRIGEAVTIVVSLVRALFALHSAGYWHGSLSASKVMFAADGRPVLVGLSHAVPVARPVGASTPSAAPDDAGFREIVDLVAKAVGDAAYEPAAGELAATTRPGLAASMDSPAWLRLEARIFGVGRPEPVLLVAPSAPLAHGVDAEAVVATHVPGWIEEVGATIRSWVNRDRVVGMVRLAREKRKLLVYSAGCIVVVGAIAAAMVTAPPTGERRRVAPAAADGAAVSVDVPATASATPTVDDLAAATAPAATDAAPQDEPVDAAVKLLRVRFECFSSGPVAEHCLAAVVQPGSAMESSDRAELQAGATVASASSRDFRSYDVSLIERMGDAALLALTPSAAPAGTGLEPAQTKPASLLIVRGEAGWRLRELFEN